MAMNFKKKKNKEEVKRERDETTQLLSSTLATTPRRLSTPLIKILIPFAQSFNENILPNCG